MMRSKSPKLPLVLTLVGIDGLYMHELQDGAIVHVKALCIQDWDFWYCWVCMSYRVDDGHVQCLLQPNI